MGNRCINNYKGGAFLWLASLCALNSEAAFHLENIEDIVSRENPRSVSDFMKSEKIPAFLRKNFLALKESTSVQAASVDCPRILIHNEDSSMVMSFNCGTLYADEEEEHSASSLEIVQLNRENGEYEAFSLHLTSQEAVISDKNPELCLQCHAEDERPLTTPGKFWMTEKEKELFVKKLETWPESSEAKLRYKSLNWKQSTSLESIKHAVQKTWIRPWSKL
ncbi:MAG: hypothetical protein R3A80_13435 [Bdellovibrionota bacterium]